MGEQAAAGPGDGRFVVDGVEFVSGWGRPSRPGSLTLLKETRMVARYEALLAPYPHPRLVELGISQGGSVALLALLARPERFVAIDIAETPVAPLVDLLEARGLTDSVHPYFGVDQGDRDRLGRIVDEEFGDDPLDIVVDDASHLYRPTVASFEVLFPRLRPGGVYVVEDWTWQDLVADAIGAAMADESRPDHDRMMAGLGDVLAGRSEPEPPLSLLAAQLALARAQTGVVADVVLDQDWITIRRGTEPLDGPTFRLTDLFTDHFGVLQA